MFYLKKEDDKDQIQTFSNQLAEMKEIFTLEKYPNFFTKKNLSRKIFNKLSFYSQEIIENLKVLIENNKVSED